MLAFISCRCVCSISYSAEFFVFNFELYCGELYILYKKITYNCIIMTIQDWLGLTLTALSILAIVGVSVRWAIRHYLKDVLQELKPNGGSSMKDQVNRLERDIVNLKNQNIKGEEYHEKLDSKLDHLTEIFINYVSRQK